ncbi:MAG: right-handed parallel beta-helix repeat-containing protein [Vibrionaceae bacterium]|nr:right-handed parallel beta-helix repeat-containing protein [Vibrionaceae bacterium]
MKYKTIKFVLMTTLLFSYGVLAIPIPNDGIDDGTSIQKLIIERSNDGGGTITLQAGVYDICSSIYVRELSNVTLRGEGRVVFKKCPSYSHEYLLYVYNSDNFVLDGLEFYGLTSEQYEPGNHHYSWGEQGVLFAGTSNSSVVNSKFFNFGDAALRVTSSRSHPSQLPINSKNFVADSNVFYNVTQVTTTHVWSSDFGGTQNVTFTRNLFKNIKGSLKLSSRKPVSKALIQNNMFVDMHGNAAIELNYYSEVDIRNNSFVNLNGYILNAYPNSLTSVNEPIDWGDIRFIRNIISNAKGGLRFLSDIAGELVGDDDNISGIIVAFNQFNKMDFSAKQPEHSNIINFLSKGGKKTFMFVDIKENTYELQDGQHFVKSYTGQAFKQTGNVKLDSH